MMFCPRNRLFFLPLEILLPIFDYLSLTALKCQRIRRHLACDSRARGGGRVLAYLHGCYKIGVAADKRIRADLRAELVHTVVIRGNTAAAEIDAAPHVAVADICKMRDRRIFADIAVLDLHKIAYLHALADNRTGTELRERTDLDIILDR